MRHLFSALLLLFCLCQPAYADRVMEVQNIHVDGAAGRDAAVADATKQAAQQVWSKLGHATPLPDLTPTQLQGIASYVDVANEVAQPNYYAANFNIGIQVGALMRLAGGGSSQASQSASSAERDDLAAASGANTPPAWVLIIAGRENDGSVKMWNPADPWGQAWQRAAPVGVSTAVASGDQADQALLNGSMVQNYDPDLSDKLRSLAHKYGAPAVALVLLDSQRPEIAPNEEVQIEVTYLEKDMPEATTAQGSLFVTAANDTPAVFPQAVTVGQKLLNQMVSGVPTEPAAARQPQLSPRPAGQFGNTYTAVPSAPANKLWVRIPLSGPMDLANYRRKIEAIPGARFEITALNRMYVEGNILYSGDQNTLMQQLASAGLRQQ